MQESYIWSHAPLISSPPKERILYFYEENKNKEVAERAIFELENGKFLYILYYGTLDNTNVGITDIEEFDDYMDALKLFQGEED